MNYLRLTANCVLVSLVVGQNYTDGFDYCATALPSGGDSESCISTLECLQEYAGVCVDLVLPDDLRMEIENSPNTTVEEVELAYKSILCSIFDTPELKAINQDPCSLLSSPQLFSDGMRGLQGMLVDPKYPNGIGEETDETVVAVEIGFFLTGGVDKRSDADRYSQWVFEDLANRRIALANRKKGCALGQQVANGAESVLGLIPAVSGAITNAISSQSAGVCEAFILADERSVMFAEMVQARVDTHDALLDAAEIEAINTNVRAVNMRVNDLTTANAAGQQQIEMKADAVAAQAQANFQAQSMRLDALDIAVDDIGEDIDANFRALSLRIDELEKTIKDIVGIATAIDAAVSLLAATLSGVISRDGSGGGGGREPKRSGKSRRHHRERYRLLQLSDVKN